MTEHYNRPPRHIRKELFIQEAAERLEYWNGLNTMEKIAALDARLGANIGAKKQRLRLKTKLEAEYALKDLSARADKTEKKKK